MTLYPCHVTLFSQVIRGDPVSMSCDLFSFGMIVLEIHTCELPYADVPEMMVNVRIATGQVSAYIRVCNIHSSDCTVHIACTAIWDEASSCILYLITYALLTYWQK